MGAPDSAPLPAAVAPGQSIDLSLDLAAPAQPGRYQGFWLLQAPQGQIFGVGPSADQPIWARIRASEVPVASATPTLSPSPTAMAETLPSENVVYDLAADACSAQWISDAGVLPCPGSESDPPGSVLLLQQAGLEDAATLPLPTLLLLPPSAAGGNTQGIYPGYSVQPGDHFRAVVGCGDGATTCSVLFDLAYQDETGLRHELWSIGEFYDGQHFSLDLDLAGLAGQKVSFILGVSSLGAPAGDRALWVDPRVVNLALPTASATSTLLPASPTASPSPSLTPTPLASAPTPTAPAGAAPGPSSYFERILQSIVAFFQSLFGK
jgi:hypothetical protein